MVDDVHRLPQRIGLRASYIRTSLETPSPPPCIDLSALYCKSKKQHCRSPIVAVWVSVRDQFAEDNRLAVDALEGGLVEGIFECRDRDIP